MKILFVLPNLTTGGIQTQVLLLAKYFKNELGLEVEFWGVHTMDESFTAMLQTENISFEFHPEIKIFHTKKYDQLSLINKLKIWELLRRRINKGKYKAIFPFTDSIDRVINVIWRFTQAKISFSFQRGGNPTPLKQKTDNYSRLIKLFKPTYVSNSQHGKFVMSIEKCLNISDIHLIRNAYVPKQKTNKPESWFKLIKSFGDSLIVTMIANFFNQKDQITLIKAWKIINMKYNAKLIFAGLGGPEICVHNFNDVKQLTHELQLQESVIFLGNIKDTSRLLELSDIGILSSKSEGCPNVILEYMGAKLPVIGTNIPGIRELLPKENSRYLFEVGDVDQCALMISTFLSNHQLRLDIGMNNNNHVCEHFYSNNMYEAYFNILKRNNVFG